MKISVRRIMPLGIAVLMVTAFSCKKSSTKEDVKVETMQAANNEPQLVEMAPLARIPSPVPGKTVTYRYGIVDPRYAAGYHTGDDYAAPTGTKVVAVLPGKIVWSNNTGGAYGTWIGLRANNGRDYVYCHLSLRSVSTGATVTAGQKLGEVGATGNVTGPHLHFEDRPHGGGYGQVRKPSW